jgi:hypothetical protein
VKARSAWNKGAEEIVTQRTFPILPRVTSVALTPDVASPRLLGDTVTFTATASGGQGPYQYRWWVGSPSLAVVRNWSTSNVFAWTPDMVSFAYQMKVEVRSAAITGPAEREATQNYEIRNPTILTLTPNLSSPRPAGATIRWTATASGGAAPYQFQWVVFDGTTWTNVTTWITSNPSNTYDWTPTVPFAGYRVAVRVRSYGNTGLPEATVILPFVIQ